LVIPYWYEVQQGQIEPSDGFRQAALAGNCRVEQLPDLIRRVDRSPHLQPDKHCYG